MGDKLFRPSKAHQWLTCRASVLLTKGVITESPPGPDALRGHAAHALADWCFRSDALPAAYVSDTIPLKEGKHPVDAEMRAGVERYVSDVLYVADGAQVVSEQEIEVLEGIASGICDAWHVTGTVLHVHDLKFGWIVVSAEYNPQLLIYAGGILDWLGRTLPEVRAGIESVEIHIHMPNLRTHESRKHTLTDVENFCAGAAEHARELQCSILLGSEPGPEDFCAGAHCRYCTYKGMCKAFTKAATEEVLSDFDDLDGEPALRPVGLKSDAELAADYGRIPLLKLWQKAIEDEVQARLSAGQHVPGYKLVQARQGARKWLDEQAALKKMKIHRFKDGEIFQKKLVSPTQFEKVAGDKYKKYLELITKPEGGYTVAPESDKRPAVGDCTNDFDTLPEGGEQ
jgi:hypothetical protein